MFRVVLYNSDVIGMQVGKNEHFMINKYDILIMNNVCVEIWRDSFVVFSFLFSVWILLFIFFFYFFSPFIAFVWRRRMTAKHVGKVNECMRAYSSMMQRSVHSSVHWCPRRSKNRKWNFVLWMKENEREEKRNGIIKWFINAIASDLSPI